MKPIPVAFHIGPLEVHTYGIGLAVTFWFAYWYFERRLRARGYRTDWLVGLFLWVIVAAVVGRPGPARPVQPRLLRATTPATSSPSGTAASRPSAGCCWPCPPGSW